MLAGNSSNLSSSSSSNSSSSDPLRTLSASCPQMGSAAAVATDHSSQGTDIHPDSGIPEPQIDAALMLSLPPIMSSDFLSTTLNSKPVAFPSSSSTSQLTTTTTTKLTSTINGAPQNGLCGEDSDDCYLSTHHCHGSNVSSGNGDIFPAGIQEDMPSETSSEQPGSCGSALSMGDVGGGKDLTSLADDADNGNSDDGIKTKQYINLKNTTSSLNNELNSSLSETSPVSWVESITVVNGNVNLIPPLVTNSTLNSCSVGYLWQQLEKLMPHKHESVSEVLYEYGIGKGVGSSHDMENSEENQFWEIVQSKSLCTLNIA